MKTIFLIISFFSTHFLNAQYLDRKLLNDKVKKIDTADKFKESAALYIVNGIPFNQADSIKLDSTLQSHNLKYLVSLDLLTCATTNIIPCNKPFVLILFAYNQKRKKKRSVWKKAKNSFNDNYISFSQNIFNAKDPVLFINNEAIKKNETKKRLKQLSLKKIYYIDYNGNPVKEELYGQNGKNGLIRIWTVPK